MIFTLYMYCIWGEMIIKKTFGDGYDESMSMTANTLLMHTQSFLKKTMIQHIKYNL